MDQKKEITAMPKEKKPPRTEDIPDPKTEPGIPEFQKKTKISDCALEEANRELKRVLQRDYPGMKLDFMPGPDSPLSDHFVPEIIQDEKPGKNKPGIFQVAFLEEDRWSIRGYRYTSLRDKRITNLRKAIQTYRRMMDKHGAERDKAEQGLAKAITEATS
jgi:hypothetical protein